MEFIIGEKVKGKHTSEEGTVIDRLFQHEHERFVYLVRLDNGTLKLFADYDLESKKTEYRIETEIADNVVIGIIYEVDGDLKKEVCRRHAHIIHQGAEGIAQACAYAYKQAFKSIDSGIYFKQKRKQGN